MNIVQIIDSKGKRRVGLVSGDKIILLKKVARTTELAILALKDGVKLMKAASTLATAATEDYPGALKEGRVLTPVDHDDPAHCMIAGTGLTHLGSASARDSMHAKLDGKTTELSDSLKMFKMGLEGGKPAKGQAGVQPEWFYKGDGSWLVPPGGALPKPSFALDGGEEPELAGLYMIDAKGKPVRLGFALGNEYSDHVTERQNYLFLAHSKLRHCSIGPEMIAGAAPNHIEGMSRINRGGKTIWQKPFLTGEANMSHTIANLEYHHFKYAGFRRPGDVHIHFFGTATLSIADGIVPLDGDEFEISAPAFGAPLRNRLKDLKPHFKIGSVKSI
jgi:hypothetical protein